MSPLPLGILASVGGTVKGPLLYNYTNNIYTTGVGSAAKTFLEDLSPNGTDAQALYFASDTGVEGAYAPTINQYNEIEIPPEGSIRIPDNHEDLQNYTISMWLQKPTDQVSGNVFYSPGIRIYSELAADGTHRLGFFTGAGEGGWSNISSIGSHLFEHVVITVSGSAITEYQNKKVRQSLGGAGPVLRKDHIKLINSYTGTLGPTRIKDFRLYDYAMSSSEVIQLYDEGYDERYKSDFESSVYIVGSYTQGLTGGLTRIYGNGTTGANWTIGWDYIRMAWPAWSDSKLDTNNTYDLTGATRYVAEVDTTGMNSSYGYFGIQYPNSSGGFTQPYSYPRATARTTYNIPLTDAAGSGKIRFNGGNTFGDVYVYSLSFKFD